MQEWRAIIVWLFIQIVPLGILYFVYRFFSEQNFFSIEGLWKGVVASGPIAAYIFITWIGFRYFKELFAAFDPKDNFDNLVGNWKLDLISEHRTAASGDCEIRVEKNRLKLTGTFDEGDRPTRLWASDIAFVDGNRVFYVYQLDAQVSYIGYVRLQFSKMNPSKDKVEQMVGEWIGLGEEKKRGKIVLSRKSD
jgi:hypothetical protein